MKSHDSGAFRVYLLGMPQIIVHDHIAHVSRRKALALLAYLAVMDKPVSRLELAVLLSPDQDQTRAYAELRRAWAALKEAGLHQLLIADRETLALAAQTELWIDVREFNHLAHQAGNPSSGSQSGSQSASIDVLQQMADLYKGDFMQGFSLRGSDIFYDWQISQTQEFQRRFLAALEQLIQFYTMQHAYEDALPVVERFLTYDYFDENLQQQAMQLYANAGQITPALHLYEDYRFRLQAEMGISPQPETVELYERLRTARSLVPAPVGTFTGNIPPLPSLVLGREQASADLKRLLIRNHDEISAPMTSGQIVIQGWPGIGKTTFTSAFARDAYVQAAFPDGILWISLGQSPDLAVALQTCAASLGLSVSAEHESLEAITSRLATLCRDRQMLCIVDDVWNAEDFIPFNFMGPKSAALITTRDNGVAQRIALRPEHIYKLPILNSEQGLQLFRVLAPDVVRHNPLAVEELICDLEGLPLALQIAARLLRAEYSMGWDITDLLKELRTGSRILSEQPPLDRTDILQETTPTVAALLHRSTDRLDEETKIRFALLGVFAAKPASFDLGALRAVWQVEDPKPTVRTLVHRGLMEPIGGGEFQIHALLVAHAKSLFAPL